MITVLITGGSGMIGRRLTKALQADGHAVRWLGRSARQEAGVATFQWNIAQRTMDPRALDGVDHIVHLSGAGIADKRWTAARKKEVYSSRVDAAALLLEQVRRSGAKPRSFISASGINYYGTITTDRILTESDPAGNDFLGRLTKAWEDAADAWSPPARVVKLRTSMVLAREGGALPQLARPARWGLGAPLGTGRQWVPWVHIDDLVQGYLHAITDERMEGAYNIVAPEPVTNAQLMQAVAHTLHRPFFGPRVPAFALRLALGEMSSILLEGFRASGARSEAAGITYRHPRLNEALREAL